MLAGTPIGDAADASPALGRALTGADVVAAEDTRQLQLLLHRLGLATDARVVSYFEGNEASRTPGLVAAMLSGQVVVLVTDAGMPLVSDPGYRLVLAAIEAGVRVTAVPGPSAVLTALAVSGLPVDRFCFEGFLPRKPGERRRRFEALAGEERTMVFFEAPHRLAEFLADAADALGGDRPAAICRELTKPYEQVVRGPLAELARWAGQPPRGEITIVIKGAPEPTDDWESALGQVRSLVATGAKLSEAVGSVARANGLRRKALYERALADRAGQPAGGAANEEDR